MVLPLSFSRNIPPPIRLIVKLDRLKTLIIEFNPGQSVAVQFIKSSVRRSPYTTHEVTMLIPSDIIVLFKDSAVKHTRRCPVMPTRFLDIWLTLVNFLNMRQHILDSLLVLHPLRTDFRAKDGWLLRRVDHCESTNHTPAFGQLVTVVTKHLVFQRVVLSTGTQRIRFKIVLHLLLVDSENMD